MILAKLLPIWGLIKRVPWPVFAALAVLIAAWLYGNHRAAQERAEIAAELREAEAEAVKNSLEAASKADTKAAKRAEVEAKVIGEQIEAIEAAEVAGRNPLDELF